MASVDCSICSNSSEATEAFSLPCGHTFHAVCISQWLWRNTSCPICRNVPQSDSDSEVGGLDSEGSDSEGSSDSESEEEALQQERQRSKVLNNILRRKSTYQNPVLARKSLRYKALTSTASQLMKRYCQILATIGKKKDHHDTLLKSARLRFQHQLAVNKQSFQISMRSIKEERSKMYRKLQRDTCTARKLADELLTAEGYYKNVNDSF